MCGKRSVLLHVRCGHCMKLYQNDVGVPLEAADVDDEDLVDSAFIRDQRFRCPKCEGVYAEIVAYKIKQVQAAC